MGVALLRAQEGFRRIGGHKKLGVLATARGRAGSVASSLRSAAAEMEKRHENDSQHPSPSADRIFALPLQARAGLSATLRGQRGLALQSKKSEFAGTPQKKKGLPASQKSSTSARSARLAEV